MGSNEGNNRQTKRNIQLNPKAMTKVIFKYHEKNSDLFAFFPDEVADSKGNKMSYQHIGQHSACSDDYNKESRLATKEEYKDLLNELINVGYDDLEIINEKQVKYWRQPTKGEIKFGEGAIHYRDFIYSEVAKKNGELKKWFISEDKLRYNY